MGRSIKISIGDESFAAELNDSPTAEAVWEALPIESSVNRWGDEFYFSIPVDCAEEPGARAEFEVGELGYWPPGNAFCIFFGPTPVSRDERPMMANPGNPIGMISDDPGPLKAIAGGAAVRIERS